MEREIFMAVEAGDLRRLQEINSRKTWNSNLLLQVTPKGNTALHLAARFNHVNMVEELCRAHPLLMSQTNNCGHSALHLASRIGNSHVTRMILDCACNCSTGSSPSGLLERRNRFDRTTFHEAVRNNHLAVVVELLHAAVGVGAGIQLNAVNSAGETALYIAAENGATRIVDRILCEPSLNLGYLGPSGWTPLHVAVIKGHLDVLQVLVNKVPDMVHNVDARGRVALHHAASIGSKKMVMLLLTVDSSTAHIADDFGRTPLHMASMNGHTSSVAELIFCCPESAELVDKMGKNILHVAVERGKLNVAEYILENNALEDLLNEQDIEGNSPLHLATNSRALSIVYLLCTDSRIDARLANKQGQTALDIANLGNDMSARVEKFRISRALKFAGARPGKLEEENGQGVPKIGQPDSALIESYKARANTLSLMATLIATVTFAAVFTIPGGYLSDGPHQGMAMLSKKVALEVFIVADTVALSSSIIVAFVLIWAATGDHYFLVRTLRLCMELMWLALISMSIAFVTAVYAVMSKSHWAMAMVLVLGSSIPFLVWLSVFLYLLPLPLSWRRLKNIRLLKLYVLDFSSLVAFDDLDMKSSIWSRIAKLLFWRNGMIHS